MTFAQLAQKFMPENIFTDFVQRLHEVQQLIFHFSQLGNISDRYFVLSQIGKQGKPVQVYKFASSVNRALFTIFAHALVGATSPNPFKYHLAMMATRLF